MAKQDQTIRFSVEVDNDKALLSIANGLDAIVKAGGPAGAQAQELLDKFKALASQDNLLKQFTAEKAALSELGDKMNQVGTRFNELQAKIAATESPSASLLKSFANTQTTLQNLNAEYGKHEANLARVGNALQSAGVNTNNLDAAQRAVQGSLAGAAAEAKALGTGMQHVAETTEHAGEKMAFGSAIAEEFHGKLLALVSGAAALELALKAIEFGAESLKSAENVEASLSRVKALAQGTAQQFEEMDVAITAAARSVNVTSEASAAGLAALVTQGLSAQKAVDALIPTLQLAKIAQIDIGEAAQIVAQSLKAFNLPATDAQKVVDELTTASHGAAGGLNAMGSAMGTLAPLAKQLGLSFDDTVSVLGLLQSRGVDTEKSIRGLRTIFAELDQQTSPLRTSLRGLGDDSNNFGKAIAALTQNTPQARDALQGLNAQARSVVLALGGAGPDALAKFTAALKESGGAAKSASDIISDNLAGSITHFGNAFDRIFEELAKPFLKPFADELTKLANQLDEFSKTEAFKKIEESVTEFANNAAKALDALIQNVHWEDFEKNAEHAITSISDSLKALAESAKTVASALNTAGDVIGVAFHTSAAGIDILKVEAGHAGEAVANLGKGIAGLIPGGEKLSESLGKSAEGMSKFAHAADKDFSDRLGKVVDDVKDLAGVSTEAAAEVPKVADGITTVGAAAEKAAPATTAHADALRTAADASVTLGDALIPLPDYLGKSAEAATNTVAPIQQVAAATLQTISPLQSAKESLAAVTKAFAQLQNSGSATPEVMAAITAAVIAASNHLQQLERDAQSAGNSLKGAFHDLGVVSQAELKRAADAAELNFNRINVGAANTAAGLADKQNAFLAYAQRALAASAQLDDGTKASVRAQLESQASVLGVTIALRDLETQSAHSAAAVESDANRNKRSFEDMRKTAQSMAGALSGGGGGGGGGGSAPPVDDAAIKAQAAIKEMGNEGGADLAKLDDALANTRASFAAVSDAAAQVFDRSFKDAFALGNDSTGAGFGRVIKAMSDAVVETNKQLAQSRTELSDMISNLVSVGKAGTDAFGNVQTGIGANIAGMESLKQSLANGTTQIGILGKADLAPLQAALDAAISRAQQLAAQAKQADDTFNSIGQGLQNDLDQAAGNLEAIENRRFQKQLDDIKKAAAEAGKLASEEYQLDIARATALHNLKIKQLEEQQKKQSGGGTAGSNANSGGGNNNTNNGGGRVQFGGGGGDQHFHITLPPGLVLGTADEVAQKLGGAITKELKRQQGLSIKPLLGR